MYVLCIREGYGNGAEEWFGTAVKPGHQACCSRSVRSGLTVNGSLRCQGTINPSPTSSQTQGRCHCEIRDLHVLKCAYLNWAEAGRNLVFGLHLGGTGQCRCIGVTPALGGLEFESLTS
jgi:hypothetical protein